MVVLDLAVFFLMSHRARVVFFAVFHLSLPLLYLPYFGSFLVFLLVTSPLSLLVYESTNETISSYFTFDVLLSFSTRAGSEGGF